MPRLLDDGTLRKLHAAAIQIGVDRDYLNSSLPVGYAMSLRRADNLIAQLMLDLNAFNMTEPLLDGTVPLESWLENARLFAGIRVEAKVFEEALATLRSGGMSGGSGGGASSGASGGMSSGASSASGAGVSGGMSSGASSGMSSGASDGMSSGASANTSGPGGGTGVFRIYISASRKDANIVDSLEKSLKPLASMGAVVWHRGMLVAGSNVAKEVSRRLAESNLVLVVLSADYIAEEETNAEGTRAVELHGERVIPIIGRPVFFELTVFKDLHPLPSGGGALPRGAAMDDELVKIAKAIRGVLSTATAPSRATAGATSAGGGSGVPSPPSPAGVSLLDVAPEDFWQHPQASALYDTMIQAFSDEADAVMLMRRAGVLPHKVITNRGIGQLWNSILEAANSQEKLAALTEKALADATISRFHSRIRACLEPVAAKK
ncbi:MAG: TIR domain-containing protein [Polyangiaceae bacterium]